MLKCLKTFHSVIYFQQSTQYSDKRDLTILQKYKYDPFLFRPEYDKIISTNAVALQNVHIFFSFNMQKTTQINIIGQFCFYCYWLIAVKMYMRRPRPTSPIN